MGVLETGVLYLIMGLVCATAILMAGTRSAPLFVLHLLFWPFFAPTLLSSTPPHSSPVPGVRGAEGRLLDALSRLDGVAEEVLSPEIARIEQLARTLDGVEGRLLEMDALLGTAEFDVTRANGLLDELRGRGIPDDDARVQSVLARRRNIDRLRKMRDTAREDLEGAALKMEEMTAQVRLLGLADRPEGQVIELIREVAATVEGVSERLIAIG